MCNRVRFPTERYADTALRFALRRKGGSKIKHRMPCRYYECDECGGWHLTSMSLADYQDQQAERQAAET
jgi:hypothetical protein